MTFRISWLGLPAGGATFELHHHALVPGLIVGEAHLYTNGLIDTFYTMRNYLREDFTRASLSPLDIYIVQRENRRHDEFTVAFDRADRLVTSVKRSRKGVERYRFRSDNPSGPFSGALMALSQPLEIGKSYTFDIFTAINRYVIRFDVRRRDHIQTPLGDFDAILIAPYVVYWRDRWAPNTARNVMLWVSADNRHLPLRLESATVFGSLRADLVALGPGAVEWSALASPGTLKVCHNR
jgi:hypothetical protein